MKFLHESKGRRMAVLGAGLCLLFGLVTLRAQGQDPVTPPAPEEEAVDVVSRVMAFTNALDSVYTSIAGTYYGVEPILRASCYDCHSTQTNYPWYYKIPGIRGMIDNDIAEGRKHLDMERGFPFGGRGSQENLLLELREEIEAGGMPPRSYRIMHWGAGLNDSERDSVFAWVDSSLSSIHALMEAFGVEPPDESAKTVYICPMCPEVVSARPAACPKCGMDLEELTRDVILQ